MAESTAVVPYLYIRARRKESMEGSLIGIVWYKRSAIIVHSEQCKYVTSTSIFLINQFVKTVRFYLVSDV